MSVLRGDCKPTKYALPWGCYLTVDPETQFPVTMAVIHDHPRCECHSAEQGGVARVLCRFIYKIAFETYYLRDQQQFSSLACNVIVRNVADTIGLDLQGTEIWDLYPRCKPPRTNPAQPSECPGNFF